MSAKLPSLPIPRIARFLAVVAIALAAGHLVQSIAQGRPPATKMASSKVPVDIVQLSASNGPEADVAPVIRAVVVEPVAPIVLADAAPMTEMQPVLTQPDVAAPAVAEACTMDLDLQSLPAGMISATLIAPCHKSERIVLRHDGLAVTGKLDDEGRLTMTTPALTVDGRIEVLFGDGTKTHAAVPMPEVANLNRFGVQWQGDEAFLVHGLINGAEFGQIGDISAQNLGVTTDASAGFLSVLGDASVDNPLLAQIYTYPTDATIRADVVLEAAVTPQTCGHDLLGEAMASSGGKTAFTDLTLAMPDCSGVGDFLVLKNLASDMKIATN